MKKIILFIACLVLSMPFVVNAATVNSSLSCSGQFVAGSQIKCDIVVSSSVKVEGLTGDFSFNSSELSFVGFEAKNDFMKMIGDSSGFALINVNGKSGKFVAATITLKVLKNSKVSISNFVASSGSDKYNVAYSAYQVKLKSTNNNLGGLSLSSGSLSPAFSANTVSYTATVNAGSVTINATKAESVQKISGAGTKQLAYGKNTYKIVVTSESGSKKTYTIVITRPDNRSKNNYLKSLSLSNGSLSFNKNTLKYNVSVENNVSSVKITASLEDSKAIFVAGYGPRSVNLNYGNNTMLIKVKAENSSVRTYTLNINRKDLRSSNNYLKELSISSGALVFVKDTLEYRISVPYETTGLNINALAEDSKAVVKVSSTNLNVGANVITINVTAENNSVRTYKLYVTRLTEAEKMSDNNNVTKISIIGHEIEFDADVMEYDVSIGNENELYFYVEMEDSKANYVIDGNKDLKDGSVVKLLATSESGISKEYKFNISKKVVASDNNCDKCLIYGVVGFAIGAVLAFLISFVIKMKKTN